MQSKADMGVLRTLPVTPPHGNFLSNFGAAESLSKSNFKFNKKSQFRVLAKTEKGDKEEEEEEPKKWKQSLLEALDFSQTRSEEDALLLEDARQATKSGEKMSKEQVCNIQVLSKFQIHCFCVVEFAK